MLNAIAAKPRSIPPATGVNARFFARFYQSISSDPTPHLTRLWADLLVPVLATRIPMPAGWGLDTHRAVRAHQLDEKAYIHHYIGSHDDALAIHREVPRSLIVTCHDRKRGPGTVLVTASPLPPVALVADHRQLLPACDTTSGHLAIDLANGLQVPCVLRRQEPEHDSVAVLHPCASRPGALRLTYIDRIGPSSHEYPDPQCGWTPTVHAMVGHAVRMGYAAFCGHHLETLPPDLRSFLTVGSSR